MWLRASGQRDCLLLRRSEFESLSIVNIVKKLLEKIKNKHKRAGNGPFKKNSLGNDTILLSTYILDRGRVNGALCGSFMQEYCKFHSVLCQWKDMEFYIFRQHTTVRCVKRRPLCLVWMGLWYTETNNIIGQSVGHQYGVKTTCSLFFEAFAVIK